MVEMEFGNVVFFRGAGGGTLNRRKDENQQQQQQQQKLNPQIGQQVVIDYTYVQD